MAPRQPGARRDAYPITTVDEDDGFVLRQHDVRSPGEIFVEGAIRGETKSVTMKERAEQPFGLGVLPGDPGHDPTAFLIVEDVRNPLEE